MEDYNGNGDSYFFAEDEIRNAAIKVSVMPGSLIANIVILTIPPIAYYVCWPMVYAFEMVGYTTASNIFKLSMILIFVFGVLLLLKNAGKEVVVSGRGIVIRNFFFLQETISLDQVYKCEVITGLTVRSRYLTQTFSQAVIYYGENSKVSVNDNMYRGWKELVGYMELAGKTVHVDGTSKLRGTFESWLGRR